jgi:rhodanese-related sulfurtransferase
MTRHCLSLLFTAFLILPVFSCAQSGAHRKITALEFNEQIRASPGATILDVRTPEEFAEDHLEGAQNMDYRADDFDQSTARLDKSRPVYVYCLKGGRSAGAAYYLRQSGFRQVYELKGGIRAWKKAGLPVKR